MWPVPGASGTAEEVSCQEEEQGALARLHCSQGEKTVSRHSLFWQVLGVIPSHTHTHIHTHTYSSDGKKDKDSDSSDEEDSEKKKLKGQLEGTSRVCHCLS